MVKVRVTTEFWVSVYKKKLEVEGIPMFIIKKGDTEAGAILVRVSDLRGSSKLYSQTSDLSGTRSWIELFSGLDNEIESILKKQIKTDPDIWVIEIEQNKGINLLDQF